MIGTIFLHFIIAMIATLAFAVLFQAPKSEWGLCGLTGGVGWFVYEYLHSQQASDVGNDCGNTGLDLAFTLFRGTSQASGNGLSVVRDIPVGAGSRDLLCSLLSNQW